ncbi:hypothetical protein [Clostridium sp. Marseille-P2415]|uniref:hypothetical protein n=1 Tax=Clostridium sp. Marseille-P2415 TaxID=1805471 RepID=UPI00098831F7|nr:hypothetical protein [Clostridium sp. Marseille-P2415]
MSADAELLNFIYQNSQMGVETLHQLLPMTDNESFKKHLKSQVNEYKQIQEEARKLLNQYGYKEKEIGNFEKIMSYLMIDMKTFVDKSASHMAEMLILGSTRGVIDCIKRLKQYEEEADKDILSLMNRLLKFEEYNLERLKSAL